MIDTLREKISLIGLSVSVLILLIGWLWLYLDGRAQMKKLNNRNSSYPSAVGKEVNRLLDLDEHETAISK